MTKKWMKPRGDRVLIQKIGEEHLSVGGIYKSEITKQSSVRGRIIMVGDLVEDFKVGDDVFYGVYGVYNMQVDLYDDLTHYSGERNIDGDVLLLNCDDIIAIIQNEKPECMRGGEDV